MDDYRTCLDCYTMFDEDDAAFVTEGGSGGYQCPDCGSMHTVSADEMDDINADAEERYNNQGF